MKFVIPVVWIGGFGFGTAMLFRPVDAFGGRPPPPDMKWLFLAVLVVGSIFMYWWCGRLMRVVMTDMELRISNYRREIVVPLSDVEEVTENRWVNVHPVTIHFRGDTEFGRKISFMPKARVMFFWSSHPVVGELRRMVAAAATGSRA